MQNQPPNYSNYYRAPQTFGQPPGTPEVSFDSITVGWNILKSDFGLFAVGLLIAGAISYAVTIPISFLSNTIAYGGIIPQPGARIAPGQVWTAQAIVLPFNIILQGLMYVYYVGIMDAAYRKMAGAQVTFSDLFVGFKKFGPLFGLGLLHNLIVFVGICLCIVPGIYLAGALAFAPLICLHHNCGPIDAIKKSMEVLNGGRAFLMFLLLFVAALLSALGLIACCVGILFTGALAYCVLAASYYNFFPPAQPNYAYGAPQGYVPPGQEQPAGGGYPPQAAQAPIQQNPFATQEQPSAPNPAEEPPKEGPA